MIGVDCLKHIVSFLDWTCDFGTFYIVIRTFKLTSDEKDIVLAYWHKNTRFEYLLYPDREEWHVNDKRHRLDGPAVIWPAIDLTEWWHRGHRYRLDSIERTHKYEEWYINGKRINIEVRKTYIIKEKSKCIIS